jgi:glycosyltransferase involved in cell wall biosynthesis
MVDPGGESRVSVIIPTHNRAALVPRAVSSALYQCREGDEVIVVDDQSDDDTEERLRPFGDRILYRKVRRGGAGRARNVGIGLAQNPLVAFLDSDDEWMPGKLEVQRSLLRARPDVLFCFSDLMYKYPSGREEHSTMRYDCGDDWLREDWAPPVSFSSIAPLPEGHADFHVHFGDLYRWQMERDFVQVGTLLYRRGPAGGSVRFPEDLETREDSEFVGRLARMGRGAYLDVETEIVHRHEGPQLTKQDDVLLLPARLKLLERLWGSDEEFLRAHGERYREVLHQVRLRRVKQLLAAGRPEEARGELGRMGRPPLKLRWLCHLPGRVTVELLRVRGYFRAARAAVGLGSAG